jgi:anti-sigma factor RsiW
VNCLRAEELFSDHLDGTLHELLRRELDGHVAACDRCAPLLAALEDVVGVLHAARARQAPPPLEPAHDLAARAAAAALAAGRRAPRPGGWRAAVPARLQTMAAGLALLGTATVLAGRMALEHRWPQRLVSEAATAGVRVIERKDRALEDLRLLRVVVGATFSGRVDRVSERVDDYKRLLERRRAATRPQGAPGTSDERPPAPGVGAARPRPVSAAEPAHWAAIPPIPRTSAAMAAYDMGDGADGPAAD